MTNNRLTFSIAFFISASFTFSLQAADPWADSIVEYTPGTGISNDFVTGTSFDDPTTALGEPTRFTSDPDNFGGPVHPFNGPFRSNEIVSIGTGGHLTVEFDEPVVDDPLNPFGIDLLVFGNTIYFLEPFETDGIAGQHTSEGGIVEVSTNGTDFFEISGVAADGIFPTMAYQDVLDPLATDPGTIPTDFTKPVDPNFNPAGLTLPEIVAGYNGSGGGVGIDLASVGLSEISFVRISNPSGDGIPEIDGFADVRAIPEPAAVTVLAGLLLGWSMQRQRT